MSSPTDNSMIIKTAYEDIQPWDRQQKESAKAFEAFTIFRNLTTRRTGAEVARQLGKSADLIQRWRSKYNWDERCRHFDIEMDRQSLLEMRRKVFKMNDTHAKLAQSMLIKVARKLNTMEIDSMSVNDLNRMVEVATKLERLSMGMPSDTTATELTGAGGEPLPVQATTQVVKIYIPDNGRGDADVEE